MFLFISFFPENTWVLLDNLNKIKFLNVLIYLFFL